jgi:hypothetical protein
LEGAHVFARVTDGRKEDRRPHRVNFNHDCNLL